MTKTLKYSARSEGLTGQNVLDILTAAASWHDPDPVEKSNRVNRAILSFEDGGTFSMDLSVSVENVALSDIQTEVEALATGIGALPGDWGTQTERIEKIRME